MTIRHTFFIALYCVLILPLSTTMAQYDAFAPVKATVLDRLAFTPWVDGQEALFNESIAKGGPLAIVWTDSTKPEFRGLNFGEGRATGVRHLRLGFQQSTAIGSVLVRGGGVLSVLRPDAAYPGSIAGRLAVDTCRTSSGRKGNATGSRQRRLRIVGSAQ